MGSRGPRPIKTMNNEKIKDALKQCLEDYMVSAEQAITRHKSGILTFAERGESEIVITKCHERIALLVAALEELT